MPFEYSLQPISKVKQSSYFHLSHIRVCCYLTASTDTTNKCNIIITFTNKIKVKTRPFINMYLLILTKTNYY